MVQWEPEEEQYLRDNCEKMSTGEISDGIRSIKNNYRSPQVIFNKLAAIGLKAHPAKPKTRSGWHWRRG